MERLEVRTHSDDQILDAVMFGLAMVENVDPPDELRVAVFTKAADMFSAKQIVMRPKSGIAVPNLRGVS